jgi:hypothetical protein
MGRGWMYERDKGQKEWWDGMIRKKPFPTAFKWGPLKLASTTVSVA